MIAFIIDVFGSYFLVKKTLRWRYLIPLAILLGIASSFISALTIHYVFPDTFSAAAAGQAAGQGCFIHPFVCMTLVWYDRRQKIKVHSSNKTIP